MSIQSHFSLTFWTLNSQDLLNVILTQDIRIWIAFPSDCKSIRSICTGFILVSERNCGYKNSDFIVWNEVIHRCPDSVRILGKSCPFSVCPAGQGRDRAVLTSTVLVRRCLVIHIKKWPRFAWMHAKRITWLTFTCISNVWKDLNGSKTNSPM